MVCAGPGDLALNDLSDGLVGLEDGFCKLLGPAHAGVFHEHMMGFVDLGLQVLSHLNFAYFAQTSSTAFDLPPVHLRHLRCRGALPDRIGKDVEPCEPAVFDEL